MKRSSEKICALRERLFEIIPRESIHFEHQTEFLLVHHYFFFLLQRSRDSRRFLSSLLNMKYYNEGLVARLGQQWRTNNTRCLLHKKRSQFSQILNQRNKTLMFELGFGILKGSDRKRQALFAKTVRNAEVKQDFACLNASKQIYSLY